MPPAGRIARRTVRYQPVLQRVRGLSFEVGNTRPLFVSVPTLANPQGNQRFPCVEALLGTAAYIHDCTVFVLDDAGREHKFLVSCQYGSYLHINRPLEALAPGSQWTGSLLVMKMGDRAQFVRLGAQDKDLAIEAVLRFINAVDDFELPDWLDY